MRAEVGDLDHAPRQEHLESDVGGTGRVARDPARRLAGPAGEKGWVAVGVGVNGEGINVLHYYKIS